MSAVSVSGASDLSGAPASAESLAEFDASGSQPDGTGAGDRVRRAELSAFLRSRRERISPQQAGLPIGGRRRTPGLRREEVAQLAGVGVTWYTWLEQGRDIKASDQVLDAISRALVLDPIEREHLYILAGSRVTPDPNDCVTLSPTLAIVLDKLEPYPAAVQNGRYDLLAHNRGYANVLPEVENVPPEDRNCMWLLFTHPAWREAVVDWEDSANRMVAQFRGLLAEHVHEPAWKAHLKRMRQVPEFAHRWERHEIRPVETHTKRFRNPHVGMLHLDYLSTWLGPRSDARLLTYLPHDAETARRLERLAEPAR